MGCYSFISGCYLGIGSIILIGLLFGVWILFGIWLGAGVCLLFCFVCLYVVFLCTSLFLLCFVFVVTFQVVTLGLFVLFLGFWFCGAGVARKGCTGFRIRTGLFACFSGDSWGWCIIIFFLWVLCFVCLGV